MNQYESLARHMKDADVQKQLAWLYGADEKQLAMQTERYISILKRHEQRYSAETPVALISAPGRCEVGGNHTDHNRGRVLAASVNLDTLAAVSPRSDMTVRLASEGYRPITVSLDHLEKREDETGRTAALIRGVAFRMRELGYAIGGFDAEVTSTVASGSGLSSSAAFEVLISAIFDKLYNRFDMTGITRAKIGQFAENVYFGKPSGLLDQSACAYGGPQLACDAIEYNFGVRIDGYVKIGYDILIDLVDGVGGITIPEVDAVEAAALAVTGAAMLLGAALMGYDKWAAKRRPRPRRPGQRLSHMQRPRPHGTRSLHLPIPPRPPWPGARDP